MDKTFLESTHRRWNPLKREWVVVSPHRTQRPWQGQKEETIAPISLTFDPTCYLCPGNQRAGALANPRYTGTFVFENDFPALAKEFIVAALDDENVGLLRAETESGVCRVICFSPQHDLTLANMALSDIVSVVELWTDQAAELGERTDVSYVQIFENRGAMMGASNPHPHCQIWATRNLPNEPAFELGAQREYLTQRKASLLSAYLALEIKRRERIVAENESWVALVPFWAVWPFETMLLPRRNVASLEALTTTERESLASMLKTVAFGYNQVFNTPFPYSMGLHPAPSDDQEHPEWQLHVHFYPPLLRSASIRKFMVGFELLGSPQRDLTPEAAAAILRVAVQTSQRAPEEGA